MQIWPVLARNCCWRESKSKVSNPPKNTKQLAVGLRRPLQKQPGHIPTTGACSIDWFASWGAYFTGIALGPGHTAALPRHKDTLTHCSMPRRRPVDSRCHHLLQTLQRALAASHALVWIHSLVGTCARAPQRQYYCQSSCDTVLWLQVLRG